MWFVISKAEKITQENGNSEKKKRVRDSERKGAEIQGRKTRGYIERV